MYTEIHCIDLMNAPECNCEKYNFSNDVQTPYTYVNPQGYF